jgi:hypothetical protein
MTLTATHNAESPAADTKGGGFLVLLIVLLFAASWIFFKPFIVATCLAGTAVALLLRRWRTRHPAVLPDPTRSRVPEINLSRIPVGGDVAGLMFAVGSVVIVIVGVPDMAWYFVSALVCGALLAWVRAGRVPPDRLRSGRPLGLR